MSKIYYRQANSADIDTVYKLFSVTDKLHRDAHPEIFKATEAPEGIKEYYLTCICNPEAVIYVAESQSDILGAVICTLQTTPEIPILVNRTFGCIENITVSPAYRRSGIGTGLMERAQEWAQANGATTMELTVWKFNQGAASFYQKLGYTTLRKRMSKGL